MAKSLEEQLESVQDTISRVEAGNDPTFSAKDLPGLYAKEESLLRKISMASGNHDTGVRLVDFS